VNAGVLSLLADAARELSGLTTKDMDELEGNSEGVQSESSSSISPSLSGAPSKNSSTPSLVAN
jgi:hypothetical protein